MGTQIPGVDSFPSDFTIPDDGDARSASSVNVALEALADRTIWLRNNLVVLETLTVLATAAVVAPEGATFAVIEGCGGGGGGGGGANNYAAECRGSGGGGGGGALWTQHIVQVTAGTTYNVQVGLGGAGGAGNAHGVAGRHSIFVQGGIIADDIVLGGTHLAYFVGGHGGLRGMTAGPTALAAIFCWGLGGRPYSGLLGNYDTREASTSTTFPDHYRDDTPGRGGNGVSSNNEAYKCVGNPQRPTPAGGGLITFGGAAGTGNTNVSSSFWGGGAGGGGGAGAYGSGGAGGSGGAPGPGSTSIGMTAGAAANANSGGGGGGGGASGGAALATTGASGGAGGSGQVRITWLKRGTV